MKLLDKIGKAAAISMLGIAMSYAQPSDLPGDPPPAEVSAQVQVKLSFPEMISQSKALRERILEDWRHVKHLQELARKEKDVIKLNCVNDKLVQMKPQMNMLDSARQNLELSNDGDDRGALFQEVTASGENIRKLREEADQCVGEPTLATESETGYTAPDVPDSPFVDPFTPNELEPPAYASPYN